MTKLVNPSKARLYLSETFSNAPHVLDKFEELTPKEIAVVYHLVNGETVSNYGYQIADVEIKRADGCIGRIRRKVGFPISDVICGGVSDIGEPKELTKYQISTADLEALHSNSLAVFDRTLREYAIKQNIHENHDIKRLVNKYGQAGAIKRVFKQAYRDLNLSPNQWKEIGKQIDSVCKQSEGFKLDEAS